MIISLEETMKQQKGFNTGLKVRVVGLHSLAEYGSNVRCNVK